MAPPGNFEESAGPGGGNGGDGTIGGFRINSDGSLKSIGAVGGLPIAAGAQGLAGY
ncbi:MAG: hypothetical protein H0X25_21190 [Acidobacteriales bacterium]|nr:hypothetical protein [Terriglobales bacterium]